MLQAARHRHRSTAHGKGRSMRVIGMPSVGTRNRASAKDKWFERSVRLVLDDLARIGRHHRATLAPDRARTEPPADVPGVLSDNFMIPAENALHATSRTLATVKSKVKALLSS